MSTTLLEPFEAPEKHTHFLRLKGLSQKSTCSNHRDSVMHRVMWHNLRDDIVINGVSKHSHIDPTKTKNNIILRGKITSKDVSLEVQTLLQSINVKKWRKDTISAIELIFSIPCDSVVDPRDYFTEATKWADDFFRVPLVSSVIHLDEDAPHCHVILVPIVDGRLRGSEVMGNPKRIFAMQEDFHRKVSMKYGFDRKVRQKRFSRTVRRAAIELAFKFLEANSGLQTQIVRTLVEAHFNNPVPLLGVLNLKMPTPAIKGTFASIMTKPTKPDRVVQFRKLTPIEVEAIFPIEVEIQNKQEEIQPLSCVEVEFSDSVISPKTEPIEETYHRESDSEQRPQDWNDEIGEFIKPPRKFQK